MSERPFHGGPASTVPSTARLLLGAVLCLGLAAPGPAPAQVSIPLAPSAYSQSFDSIGASATATLPTDWKAGKDASNVRTVGAWGAGVTATERVGGNALSTTAPNGIYNFGAGDAATATDRAVGFLSSSSATKSGNLYVSLKNQNGGPLSGLKLSYDVEKYRRGSNAAGFTVQLHYSSDGSAWTSAGASFATSFGADADNTGYTPAPGATTSVTDQTLTVAIPDGGALYLAWSYSVSSGTTTSNAQAFGIDNVSISGIAATQPTDPTGIGSASPSSVAVGGSTTLTVTVTPGALPVSTGLAVSCDLTSIGGSAAQAFTASASTFTHAVASVGGGTLPWARSLPCTITDAESRSGSASIALTVLTTTQVHVHDVQGAAHLSPYRSYPALLGLLPAIVTAKNANGFWMEEPASGWDADDATSEAVYVYTGSAPTVSVGDSVTVTGNVQEYRPSNDVNRLTITEISAAPANVVVNSSGNALPPAIVIGAGGRTPPPTTIEDDATGSVETTGTFDPATDGIDFWESLEGMLVRLDNAVAVSTPFGTGSQRTIPVVADDASSSVRTPRGGIVLRDVPRDVNPEIAYLYAELVGSLPDVNVGDHFTTPVVGIVDSYDLFEIKVTSPLTAVSAGLTPSSASATGSNEVSVATFNVNNLSPVDPQSKFDGLAAVIVGSLKAPDVIAVEEVQDNNGTGAGDGSTPTGTTANLTWTKLITAIQAAGGPVYDYRQIDPQYNLEGGATNGNIRTGFLFRTDRGLSFVDRPCPACNPTTTATGVFTDGTGAHLTYSPGRVDPANTAWSVSSKSRPPLAGELLFRGKKLFVVGNHWLGKGADPSAYSPLQPLALPSEPQRIAQAAVVNGFVASILAAEPAANVVVLGDLNDYQFSAPLLTLKGTILSDLIETLPESERYTYIYSGNGQALDHILASPSLFGLPRRFEVVHVNAEFMTRTSDHDPQVARFALDVLPTVNVPTVDGVPTTATVSGGGAGCTFTNAAWVSLSSVPEPPPAGKVFPFGLFDFSVAGCTPGATLTFSITVPGGLEPWTQYWKYGPTQQGQPARWYQIPVTISGSTMTFQITDGGLGDDVVGVQDGAVVDQGGPAVDPNTSAIPALDPRGLAALAALLGAGGALLLASRRP